MEGNREKKEGRIRSQTIRRTLEIETTRRTKIANRGNC
jgi:hypothetical protein